MQTGNGATWGCVFGSTPPGVFTASFEMWLTALVAVWKLMFFFFRRFSAQAPASQIPLGPAFLVSVISSMAEFTKFEEAQVSGQPPISEELMTLLTAATVHKSILDGFRALGIRFSSLADDLPDLREALSEMFNVDKKHGPLHRLEASKLVEVWQQAKARTETQQKVESTARAHGMPVELPAGSWGNLVKAFQDQYGSSIPSKELPAQSYFKVLEEMTPSDLPKWSHSTLKTNIVWRTQKLILSISQWFSMVLPFVPSVALSPQCQKILKGSVQSTKSSPLFGG